MRHPQPLDGGWLHRPGQEMESPEGHGGSEQTRPLSRDRPPAQHLPRSVNLCFLFLDFVLKNSFQRDQLPHGIKETSVLQ